MKWIRKVLKGISFTAAMFVFQACYGPMEDYYSTKVTFRVVSSDTGEPVQGVAVWSQYLNASDSLAHGNPAYIADYTDKNGMATIWEEPGLKKYSFVDKDSVYIPSDTIVNPMKVDTIDIVLNPVSGLTSYKAI